MPVSATASLLFRTATEPNPLPTATTAPGRSRARALITVGSARGSAPAMSMTVAPAAFAVVVTATTGTLRLAFADALMSTVTSRSDAGSPVIGRSATRRTTRIPGSRAARVAVAVDDRPMDRTATGCSAWMPAVS